MIPGDRVRVAPSGSVHQLAAVGDESLLLRCGKNVAPSEIRLRWPRATVVCAVCYPDSAR